MMRTAWAILATTLVARPAWAAEGMPQLDFGNPLMLSQIVWLTIIFVGLYLLLGRWALPQVAGVLERRAATIGSDLEAARAAKVAADGAIAELTAASNEAHARAQAEINTAVTRARDEAAQQAARLNAELDARLTEAETRIGQARRAAMGALQQVAAEATEALVARLTGRPANPARVADAVAGAIARRG